ncbi:DUF3299 domain-containing protein [Halioglobus maricola]|nr:DUF3299 domain-containing protein [Halioglobus maricola]
MHLHSIRLFFLLCLTLPCIAFGAEDPATAYRVLEWPELVPQGWEPPLVATAHDEVEQRGIDPKAQVTSLDQQLVSIPGYMKPIVFDEQLVSEFLLVPYLPHQIKQHSHLEANQKIYIKLLEPLEVENPLAPLWVVGTMTLHSTFTDEGHAAYGIHDAITAEYTY